jgi:PAS domain S-box-containing protein
LELKGLQPDLAAQWEQQYHLLLESMHDAAFVHDDKGVVVAVNAVAERLSGYKRADLIGMRFEDLLAPVSREPVMRLDAPAGQVLTQAELLRRDGVSVPVALRVSTQRGGVWPLAVLYLARETSRRERFQDTLERQTPFRLMAQNLTEMLLTYDMDRRLTYANAAVETLTGYSVAELEKSQFICWVHPEDRQRMLGLWDLLFEGRSFSDEPYRLITRDGQLKWVAASWGPILDDAGRQLGVQGRERDITARRLAEETLRHSEQALRISEERYRTLFDASPFPMWEEDFSSLKRYLDELARKGVTDLREFLDAHRDVLEECANRVKILDVNRAAREFYGASDRSEMPEDLGAFFDEAAYDGFREELAVLAENNSRFQTEFRTHTLAGEVRTVNMIVSIVPSPNNDWSRVIVSFFDITDRKRLEEQLLQSQKLESLGRLAGGIAHDFNNLLTVINGYSELVLTGLPERDTLRSQITEIRNAGARGAELTQQLLAFSRKQVAQLRPMDLNGLIQESESMLRRVIGEDVRLLLRLDPNTGPIKADRGQMHQVLMNLVVNGREAMPNGGTLTIETRNVDLGANLEEKPGAPGTRPFLLLRVRDTGIGMDDDTKQHLFEPFFTTKYAGKGTGLGLSTVFGVVTQSGGHISVSSEVGQGAEFSVFLPRTSSPAQPEALPAAHMAAQTGTGAILVVEDQPEVRTLTCALLREHGYEVLEAQDGLEALLLAESSTKPIRLLLTDVIMPGINGKELAARLETLRPGVRTVYMSGYTDRIMSNSGVLDSSVAFLQKPFTPDQLINIVARALQ